jgi:hypothetical protein
MVSQRFSRSDFNCSAPAWTASRVHAGFGYSAPTHLTDRHSDIGRITAINPRQPNPRPAVPIEPFGGGQLASCCDGQRRIRRGARRSRVPWRRRRLPGELSSSSGHRNGNCDAPDQLRLDSRCARQHSGEIAMRLLSVVLFAMGGAVSSYAQTGTFTATGSMITPRFTHTATLLADGRVLIAGGNAVCYVGVPSCLRPDRAELYDPATRTFMATGSTSTAFPEGAVLLPDGSVHFRLRDL